MKSSPIRCHFERHSIEYFFRPTAASYANYLLLRQLHVYKVNNVFAQPPIQHPPTHRPFDFFFFLQSSNQFTELLEKKSIKFVEAPFSMSLMCVFFLFFIFFFFLQIPFYFSAEERTKKKKRKKNL